MRANIISAIDNGKIFSVRFFKRSDGSERRMVARWVPQPETAEGRNLILVWDMQARGLRYISVEGITEMRVQGRRYVWDHVETRWDEVGDAIEAHVLAGDGYHPDYLANGSVLVRVEMTGYDGVQVDDPRALVELETVEIGYDVYVGVSAELLTVGKQWVTINVTWEEREYVRAA